MEEKSKREAGNTRRAYARRNNNIVVVYVVPADTWPDLSLATFLRILYGGEPMILSFFIHARTCVRGIRIKGGRVAPVLVFRCARGS